MIETREQYRLIRRELVDMEKAVALDETIEALRKIAIDQMEDAREEYLQTYDHDESDLPPPPESFEEWLQTEYPNLADLSEWLTHD